MTTDPIDLTIQRPGSSDPAAAPSAGRSAADPGFQALLESLQQLARRQPPAADEVDDAAALHSAIERADDDFQQVMDLRRRLEEAFRSRTR